MGFLRKLAFNLWYFQKPPWDSGISPPQLMDFIRTNPPGRALDLGCGTGTNVITLAANGWSVTGVDFASRAISIARRKVRAAGVSADFHIADVTRLDGIHGPFDFVLDLGCFHSLVEREKAMYLLQLKRLTAPHARWLLYGFFKDSHKAQRPGLTPGDITQIQSFFELVSREDGVDKKDRPSAYFLFKRNV